MNTNTLEASTGALIGPVSPSIETETKAETSLVSMTATELVPNYTKAELQDYLDSILSGKAMDHPPFGQKLSETNFSEADREEIRFARKSRRAIVANPSYAEFILAAISSLTMTGHSESANGVTTTLKFKDEALAEAIREARAKERAKEKKNTKAVRLTKDEYEELLASRQVKQAQKIASGGK